MWCGHSPDEIDRYPLRDVRLFLEFVPLILPLENPFIGGFDD